MSAAQPSFAPPRPSFPCPALLTAAARAPIGGEREALLGVVMAVRLVSGLCPGQLLPAATRTARADAARGWLASVALAPRLRTAVQRCLASSAGEHPTNAAEALLALMEVVAGQLDREARRQLTRVVSALKEAPIALLVTPRGP